MPLVLDSPSNYSDYSETFFGSPVLARKSQFLNLGFEALHKFSPATALFPYLYRSLLFSLTGSDSHPWIPALGIPPASLLSPPPPVWLIWTLFIRQDPAQFSSPHEIFPTPITSPPKLSHIVCLYHPFGTCIILYVFGCLLPNFATSYINLTGPQFPKISPAPAVYDHASLYNTTLHL